MKNITQSKSIFHTQVFCYMFIKITNIKINKNTEKKQGFKENNFKPVYKSVE